MIYDALGALRKRIGLGHTDISRVLNQFSQARNGRVNFIQIGASDGLRNDPIREFIVRDDWAGVFVEPLPGVFQMLESNYSRVATRRRLAFVNAAITSSAQENLVIWSFSEASLSRLSLEERLWWLRKSSLEREHVEKFVRSGSPAEPEPVTVNCLTFSKLFEQFHPAGCPLDLLVLDVEGREWEIIRSIDFHTCRPAAIFFESNHLGGDSDLVGSFLEEKGYDINRYGRDDWAVLLRQ